MLRSTVRQRPIARRIATQLLLSNGNPHRSSRKDCNREGAGERRHGDRGGNETFSASGTETSTQSCQGARAGGTNGNALSVSESYPPGSLRRYTAVAWMRPLFVGRSPRVAARCQNVRPKQFIVTDTSYR